MKAVALSSGGLDSSVLLAGMKAEGFDLLPLHVNYGQRSEEQEWKACRNICNVLGIVEPERFNLQDLGRIPCGLTDPTIDVDYAFFPTRNLLLLTLGAALAYSHNIQTVAIGLIKGAVFPDQTSDFIKQTEQTIFIATGRKISIVAPLLDLNKADVMLLASEYRVPVRQTYSCYVGGETPCDTCAACLERRAAEQVVARAEDHLASHSNGRPGSLKIPGA